jgi:hypothetical protein
MFLTFILIQSSYQHLGAKIMYVSEFFPSRFCMYFLFYLIVLRVLPLSPFLIVSAR